MRLNKARSISGTSASERDKCTNPYWLHLARGRLHGHLAQCHVPCSVCGIYLRDAYKESDKVPAKKGQVSHLAICVQRVLMPPVKNDERLMEVLSLHPAVSEMKKKVGRKRSTYRQTVHQWLSNIFPVMGCIYPLSRRKMRRTSAVRSSRGLEMATCVGDESSRKVNGMANEPDYLHLP